MTLSDVDLTAWTTYFGATLSAAATLTGLLFVSVSINLDRVLLNPRLLARAGETLIGLVLALVASAVLLIAQPATTAAAELLTVSIVVAALTLRAQVRHGPDRPTDPWWWFAVRIATVQVVAAPTAVGSLEVLLHGGAGLRWIAFGVLGGFVLAIYSAWVLLVEIVRQSPPRPGADADHADDEQPR